jgi:hypothetical protein
MPPANQLVEELTAYNPQTGWPDLHFVNNLIVFQPYTTE